MSRYFAPVYSYQPVRFRVPELHADWPHGSWHIVEQSDGIEVVQAYDYDELRRAYNNTYEALIACLGRQESK